MGHPVSPALTHVDASGAPALTHVDASGAARMVSVTDKLVTRREAVASAQVRMLPRTLQMITSGSAPKGDVLACARLAGIMAAKRTSELIPLCHPLAVESVSVELAPIAHDRLAITARVVVEARTGVEMEALVAASLAALTVYDMCKAVDRSMSIDNVQLEEKLGGASGHYLRERDGDVQC